MTDTKKLYPRTGDKQTIYLKKRHYRPIHHGWRLYDVQ